MYPHEKSISEAFTSVILVYVFTIVKNVTDPIFILTSFLVMRNLHVDHYAIQLHHDKLSVVYCLNLKIFDCDLKAFYLITSFLAFLFNQHIILKGYLLGPNL